MRNIISDLRIEDHLAICDFEFTCDDRMPIHKRELLSCGIIICNANDSLDVINVLYYPIKPITKSGMSISKYCTTLTGITSNMVKLFETADSALISMMDMLKMYNVSHMICWGSNDKKSIGYNFMNFAEYGLNENGIRRLYDCIFDVEPYIRPAVYNNSMALSLARLFKAMNKDLEMPLLVDFDMCRRHDSSVYSNGENIPFKYIKSEDIITHNPVYDAAMLRQVLRHYISGDNVFRHCVNRYKTAFYRERMYIR